MSRLQPPFLAVLLITQCPLWFTSLCSANGIMSQEQDLTREIEYRGHLLEYGEHAPVVAAKGNTAVAVWYLNTSGWSAAWSFTKDGGGTWNYGGLITTPDGSRKVVDFPTVCADSSGAFFMSVLYRDGLQRESIAVYRLDLDSSPPSFGLPQFAVPFLAENQGQYALPRIVAGQHHELYLTYSLYLVHARDPVVSSIGLTIYQNGQWSAPVILSSPESSGARSVVGQNGEVYVIWEDIGLRQIVGRRSEDSGVSFGYQFSIAADLDNLTAPPEFDYSVGGGSGGIRPLPLDACLESSRGTNFPTVAMDMSPGPRQGTIYVAWSDRTNGTVGPFFGAFHEREPNGTLDTAMPVEIGDDFFGTVVSYEGGTYDTDYFSFEGFAGETIMLNAEVYNFHPFYNGVACHGFWFNPASYPASAWLWGEAVHDAPAEPLIFTLPQTGRYYIGIGSDSYYSDDYTFHLRELRPDAGPARDHRDILITSSSDHGLTWSPPRIVNDDPPQFDNYLPELAVDDYGAVHVTWYDRRDDPGGVDYNVYWTHSIDGGLTFRPSQRISDSTSVVRGKISHLGDYMGLVSIGSGVIACWTQAKRNAVSFFGTFGTVDEDIHARRIELARSVSTHVEHFIATASPNRVRLSWKGPDKDLVWHFDILRQDHTGAPHKIGEVAPDLRDGPSTFIDEQIFPGDSLYYSLRVVQLDGVYWVTDPVLVVVPPHPHVLQWARVTPNPFSEGNLLELQAPEAGQGEVRVFDVSGAEVRTLFIGGIQQGANLYEWDGRNNEGRSVPGGIYFLKAKMGHYEARTKLVYLGR